MVPKKAVSQDPYMKASVEVVNLQRGLVNLGAKGYTRGLYILGEGNSWFITNQAGGKAEGLWMRVPSNR